MVGSHHDSLAGTPEDLGIVGSLRLLRVGQTLEGMGLKGACHVAHGSHERELPRAGSSGVADGGSSKDWRHV